MAWLQEVLNREALATKSTDNAFPSVKKFNSPVFSVLRVR